MHILIIGAKGMLGEELFRVLSEEHTCTLWDIEDVDITQRENTLERVGGLGPDVVLNTAALVDVDKCEQNPDSAWAINTVGAQNLAIAAHTAGARVLFISTDYVFDGTSHRAYTEADQPNPINIYGQTKHAAEQLVRQICPQSYIVRTSWLYGHRSGNYVDRVINAAQEKGVVRMAEDQLEAPTYTVHLAQAIRALLRTGAYGTYHVASTGFCTRVEFAREVLRRAGRTELVEELGPAEIKRVAPRPARTVLQNRLVQLVCGYDLPEWRQGIEEYFAREQGE